MQLDKKQLTQLLQFKDENIISRFSDMYQMEEEEINDILQETLKFLYISQIPGVFIPDELLVLDEMWHNLILFTPLYHQLSEQYLNADYFHHIPASKKEKEVRTLKMQNDPKTAKEEYAKKLEFLLTVIYEHLGEETVIKWFRDYPKKYSKERLKLIRK